MLLADSSALRPFLANHKFDLIALGLLNRTARESLAKVLDLVPGAVARSQLKPWKSLNLLGESEEI